MFKLQGVVGRQLEFPKLLVPTPFHVVEGGMTW